jgi:uncharacterized membrane protein
MHTLNTPRPTVLLLATASGIGVALVLARMVVTGFPGFLYLPWNLFLAWIPLGFALLARNLAESRPLGRPPVILCGLGWLLFFPNAPYILTDLIHLARVRPGSAPFWFDLLLHLIVAMTGLFVGFASLALMQGLVSRAAGRLAGWAFAVVSLALSGFGIYLGRFLRWNSWDVVLAPVSLFSDIANRLAHPLSNPRAYGFSIVCFVFLLMTYLMCFSLPRLSIQHEAEPRA